MEAKNKRIVRLQNGEPIEALETLLNSINNYLNNEIKIASDGQQYYLMFLGIHASILTISESFFNLDGKKGYKEFLIKFQEVLTDNGSEFGNRNHKNKEEHPFERMLMELNIKHRYTRPYRPQTNGKVERFWKTIEEDLLAETSFDSIEEFKDELVQYMYYYNYQRPHQGINGKIPAEFNKNCQRIT